MIIKNVSGETRYFSFGPRVRGRTLANNATMTVPDGDVDARRLAMYYASQGVASIEVGDLVDQAYASKTLPASAYIEVNGAAADNDTVTINGVVFEFENDPGSGVLGSYVSTLTAAANKWAGDGAAAGTAAGTLRTAINAHAVTLNLVADAPIQYVSGKYVIPLRRRDGAVTATGFTLDVSGTNLAKSSGGLSDGVSPKVKKQVLRTHTATDGDVSNAVICLITGLTTIDDVLVQIRTAAGVIKAYDGSITVSGGNVTVNNGGNVDFAATDLVTIMVCGV